MASAGGEKPCESTRARLPELQRLAKIVVRERERALADRGVEPAGVALEGAIEQRVRLRVVRRIVRLARPLQIGDAEIALQPGICRMQSQSALQLAHLSGIARQRGDGIERGAHCAGRGRRGGGRSTTPQAGQQAARDDDRRDARARDRPVLRSLVCGRSWSYLLPALGELRNGNAFPNRPPLASLASTPSAPNLSRPDRARVREVRAAEREQRVRALDARGDEVIDRQADQRGDLDIGDVVTEAPAVRIAVELGRDRSPGW